MKNYSNPRSLIMAILLAILCVTGCFEGLNPPATDEINNISPATIDENNPYQFANGCYSMEFTRTGESLEGHDMYYRAGDNGEPFFMKPSALGQYIFHDSRGRYLAVTKTITGYRPVRTDRLNTGAIWELKWENSMEGFVLRSRQAGLILEMNEKGALTLANETSDRSLIAFTETEGCRSFPEADLNVNLNVDEKQALSRPNPGTPGEDYTDREPVTGYADTHAHLNHFLGSGQTTFVGETFNPLGITEALKDCSSLHGIDGVTDLFGMAVDGHTSHETSGWPDFDFWPTTYTSTHQQAYYRWLERSWLAGQRVLVQQMVSNEILCNIKKLIPSEKIGVTCDDMEIAELQLNNIYDMQDYIDAQCGGPGQGWFRIVTSSREARRVIGQGKMAVFLSLEFDTVFGAGIDYFGRYESGKISRDELDDELRNIEEQLDYFYERGVRSVFPIHAFNNGFGGAQLYQTPIFNLVNMMERGSFFDVEAASNPRVQYREDGIAVENPDEMQALFPFLPFVPITSDGQGHCNTLGMSGLGEWLMEQLISRRMIIEIDHMGDHTLDRAMEILWEAKYPGVIASHTRIIDLKEGQKAWEQLDIPRMIKILQMGGIVAPMLWETLEGHQKCVADYLKIMIDGGGRIENERYEKYGQYEVHASWYDRNDESLDDLVWGVPYATDVNGACPLPNFDTFPQFQEDIDYGFGPLFPGVYSPGTEISFEKQVTGNRVFDINGDRGMAHYGLMPDMIRKMQLDPESVLMQPLFNSAEAYLRMLERVERYSETYPARENKYWE